MINHGTHETCNQNKIDDILVSISTHVEQKEVNPTNIKLLGTKS